MAGMKNMAVGRVRELNNKPVIMSQGLFFDNPTRNMEQNRKKKDSVKGRKRKIAEGTEMKHRTNMGAGLNSLISRASPVQKHKKFSKQMPFVPKHNHLHT